MRRGGGFLLAVPALLAGCGLHPVGGEFVAGIRTRSALIRAVCPDQLPPLILQDVTCPQACGYSCLPGRWQPPAGPPEGARR